MRRTDAISDEYYLKMIKGCLRKIFNEEAVDIDDIHRKIAQSPKKEDFDSGFTMMESFLFDIYAEGIEDKLFFLFECGKDDSVSFIYPAPLKPKQKETFYLSYIGFNGKWYHVKEYCELFVEELNKIFQLVLIPRRMKKHFYAYVDCSYYA